MTLLLARVLVLCSALLLMSASAGSVYGLEPPPVQIDVQENLGLNDDGAVPQSVTISVEETLSLGDNALVSGPPPPAVVSVDETFSLGDDVLVTAPPPPAVVSVDETFSLGDDVLVTGPPPPAVIGVDETFSLGDDVLVTGPPPPAVVSVDETFSLDDDVLVTGPPPPAVVSVNETFSLGDDLDVQLGPRFLDSAGFFGVLISSGDPFPTLTVTFHDEDVVVRIRTDAATRFRAGEEDIDRSEIVPGMRVAVQTAQPARVGADVPDTEAAQVLELLIPPQRATRKHTRGVVAGGAVIDEDGKGRLVEGELQDGASVVVLVQETKDGKGETRGALEEAKVQERLSRFAEKAGQAAADDQREQSPQDRAKLERLRELKEQAKAEFEKGADKSLANATDETRALLDEVKRAVLERERQKAEEEQRQTEEQRKAEEEKKKQAEQEKQADPPPPAGDDSGKGPPPPPPDGGGGGGK